MTKRVVVVGASGYAGAELVGLLAAHPEAELVALRGSSRRREEGNAAFSTLFPRFRGIVDLEIAPLEEAELLASEPDCVFLATPHELAHELAPSLVARGIVTVDLSAAFRLKDALAFERAYGFRHAQPALLAAAAYGLPELFAAEIVAADLIACPGCYPTSAILPLRPLVDAGLLGPREVIVDSASGVSGAGRRPEVKSLFCEVSLQPYGVFTHRHRPEIAAYAGRPVSFTPHLGCWDRGILSTMHAWLAPRVDEPAVRAALAAAYRNQPFVRLLPAGQWPSVAGVRGTNCCDVGLAVEGDHLLLVSAIDNLLKGAAGQAVQCFNLRFGLPQSLGLPGAAPALIGSGRKEDRPWHA